MTRSRVRRLAVLGATVLATVALGVTQAAASPVGPSQGSSVGTAAGSGAGAPRVPAATTPSRVGTLAARETMPTDCGVAVLRLNGTSFTYHGFRGNPSGVNGVRAFRSDFGTVALGQPVRAMTYINSFTVRTQLVDQYLATTTSGALLQIRNHFVASTGQFVYTDTRMLRESGWGAIRELAYGDSGLAYALTDDGGLYRYSLDTTWNVRGAGTVATSGWSQVKDLSWAVGGIFQGTTIDGLIGLTDSGRLVEYVVGVRTPTVRSFVLATSGWGGFSHVSTGGCRTSAGRPIVAFTPDGLAYAYYDRQALDLNGSDIRSVGQVGAGFSGLLFD